MSKFADLEAFTAVVESNTFSAAGERLGVAKSVVSRRISQLENRLGVRLLHRTTRRLALTEEGRHFYQRAVQILADMDDAEQSVATEAGELRGSLKLAAPLSFGLLHMSAAIADFLSQHPALELNLDLNDRTVNLVEDGFDMAVRIGQLDDSTLVAKRLGAARHVTCASPAYLEKYGAPRHPNDLRKHIGLQYSNISYKQQWAYTSNSGETLYGQPQIRVRSNNGEALAAAACAGLGITAGPTFILGRHLRSGELTPVFDDYTGPTNGIYAVYPPGRLIPGRTRAFSSFLAKRFGETPYWDEKIV